MSPAVPGLPVHLDLAWTIHEYLLRRPILSPGGAVLVRPPRRTARTPPWAFLARSPSGLRSRTPRDGIHELSGLRCDLRPDTFMREHFEKNGMRNSTVDDMGFTDTASERIQAGMYLGQHPFADRALLHHPLHVLA